MPAAKPTPDLKIPDSKHTVSVSIIDTTRSVNGMPTAAFTQPEVGGYSVILGGCSYSFMIQHKSSTPSSKHDKLLFDLGFRTDPENGARVIWEQMKASGIQMTIEKSVYDILKDQGGEPDSIGGIIWSHYHPVSTVSRVKWTDVQSSVGPHRRPRHLPAFNRSDRWTGFQASVRTGISYETRKSSR